MEEDQKEIKNHLDRCTKEGLSFDKEYKFIDFNGIEKWVHIGGHPRYKQDEIVAIYGFITDISKEHAYNKELRDAKSSAESNEIRYKNLFSNNPVSLWDEDLSSIKDLIEKKKEDVEDIVEFINTNDDFVYKCMPLVKVNDVNQATLDLYGYTQEELMLNIGNTFTESSFNSFRSLLRSLARGNSKHAMEVVYKNSKEEPIYAMFYFFASPDYLFIETLLEEKFTQKFLIKHARTGKDVLDLCDKIDDVSLILMDIKMPVMDGLTATKILSIEKPEIPIIAITAYTSFEDRQKALDNGCKAIISKPIDVKTFVNQINTHIK